MYICKYSTSLLLLCACLLATVDNCEGAENVTLTERVFYLLTLLPYASTDPFSNPSWTAGDNIQPVLEMAADQINRRSDILSNYSLRLVYMRDGCDKYLTQITFKNFVEGFYSIKIAGVLGPGCSSSTLALAPLVGRAEIDTVSVHDAGSPTLSNRLEYSHLLGVLGSTSVFVDAFFYLIDKGNWSRIALLYDDSRQYFINTKQLFLERVSYGLSDVDVEYLMPISENHMPLEDIQQKMLRVVFILAPISLARNILCLASNLSMSYSRYQYVLMSARLEDFSSPVSFYYHGRNYECSVENVRGSVLNRSFLLYYSLLPKVGVELLSNLTYTEYISEYASYRERYTQRTGKPSMESYWATNLYDAVWAWALALDGLTKEDGDLEVELGDNKTSGRIIEQFYSLNFEGMSGSIIFDNETGFVKREIVISQSLGNSSSLVVFVGPKGEERCNGTVSCDISVQTINDTFPQRVIRGNNALAAFFFVISVLELIFVPVLHVLTMVKRKRPSVKAASIELLNISYIGVYILILGTCLWSFFFTVPLNVHLQHYFCQVLWAWTIPIGFSLSFGPVLVKTWRLYRIFEHYLDPGHFISTPYLIVETMILTSLYLIASVSWTGSDHFVLNSTEYFESKEPSEVGNRVIIIWYCTCQYRIYWLIWLGLLSLVLLLAGTVLALLTRKIQNVSFETNSLRILVYLLTIVILLGLSLYSISEVLDRNFHTVHFSFATLCTLLNAVICLFIACIFVPPLLPLARTHKVIFRKISASL